MKKLYSIIAMIVMAFSATMLVSCDEDSNIAYTLEGVWEGNMYKQSYYNGRYFTSSRTVMQFDRNPYRYSSGTGKWIDYYSDAPWDYFASYISWEVNNGRIRIYSEKENQTYYIEEFGLSDNYFEGYIVDRYNNEKRFRMRKIDSPNWGSYDWNGYDWDDYYYAPAGRSAKQKAESPVTSIKAD